MVRPARRVLGRAPYSVPRPPGPITLDLRGNEGAAPPPLGVALTAELLSRYPRPAELELVLAERYGLQPSQALVTAGGDDALDRLARATLESGRTVVLPEPAFVMTRRWCELAGAEVVSVPWPGQAFPTVAAAAAIDRRTGLVALTSPNNPTGAVLSPEDLAALLARASDVGATVLLDAAYAEYAEQDLTPQALAAPGVVVVRTLSKAWGLAGARVGYALGDAEVLGWMRSVGAPYAVSGPSLALAAALLEQGEGNMRAHVAWVRQARERLSQAMTAAGMAVVPSQANFVFGRSPRAGALVAALGDRGIAVRRFVAMPDALRIGLPTEPADLDRVVQALEEVAP